MNDLKEATDAATTFPALGLMERACPPLRFGRPPTWQLPALPIDSPLIPSWDWYAVRDFYPGTEVVTLTANGGLLAAIGHVTVGHSQLNRVGRMEYPPAPRDVAPGYYRITIPHWAFGGTIVSPLGDSARLQTDEQVWIAAPTLTLLLELAEDGCLGRFTITDSWTAPVQISFRTWYERLRAQHTQLLDQIEAQHPDGIPAASVHCACLPCTRLHAFDHGITTALAAVAAGTKSGTHRPDWADAVYATHAAAMWRRAWRYTGTNRHLVALPHIDEVQIIAADLDPAMDHVSPPFLYDESARHIGSLRALHYGTLQENIPTGSAR